MRDSAIRLRDKMKVVREPSQTSQRVKVGMVGLAAVILLIVLASAILGTATRERPIGAAGSAREDVVANIASINAADAASTGEPLAELGITPSTSESNSHAAARH
ncbi:MAG TPA: hypothetical protein VF638_00295 [Sphingomonas sp.]